MVKRKFKAFLPGEKGRIRDIIKKLPLMLTSFGTITFYRQKSGKVKSNPAVTDPEKQTITIYNSIAEHSMERVVAHELAHILYHNLSDKEKDSYKNIAQWDSSEISNKVVTISVRKVFVAIDGIFSPDEDFSNNMEYYLFEKNTLKRKKPKIYNWIEQLMEDKKK